MATSSYASNLVLRIAYPALARPGLGVDRASAALPRESAGQLLGVSSLQEKQVDNIFYLAESRTLNPWALIGSLAVVSVFLLVLIAIPLLYMDPLPKREAVTMLYLPPPPAAGGKAIKFQARPTHTPTIIAIPTPVHTTPDAAPVDKTDEVIGGVPGGVAGGIPGAVLTELGGPRNGPLPAKAPELAPVKRIRVASGVAEAHLMHEVQPEYPPEAGRERIEGTVVLLAVIGSDGIVQNVQVVSGLPILAQAAIEAVKQWRYKPYLLNGVPVEIDSRITINFTMSRG